MKPQLIYQGKFEVYTICENWHLLALIGPKLTSGKEPILKMYHFSFQLTEQNKFGRTKYKIVWIKGCLEGVALP